MMILKAYSVYDNATQAFMQPFFARTNGEALRSFSDAINDEKSSLSRHLHDYSLFGIGDFNDSNGLLSPLAAPERLLTGTEALISKV